jgi:3-oxo-4,17-pregnadiene-20-carboxyl-CoA hydratase alpha subunit
VSYAARTTDVEAVITDEARAWIGRSTELMPLPEEVAASDVRRYVEATGDHNPLWLDDEAARSAGYRGRVVPPMLVIDLAWRLKDTDAGRMTDRVPLPPNYIDTRNVETEMEWLEPVYTGDRISIRHRIRDIVARPGRRGLGVYITRETEYVRTDGRLVARMLQTVARFPKAAVGTK